MRHRTKFFSPPLLGTHCKESPSAGDSSACLFGSQNFGMESPNSSHTKSAHIPLTGPIDQSSNEAPGLPVALSNIAGVTKMPEPGGRYLSNRSINRLEASHQQLCLPQCRTRSRSPAFAFARHSRRVSGSRCCLLPLRPSLDRPASGHLLREACLVRYLNLGIRIANNLDTS